VVFDSFNHYPEICALAGPFRLDIASEAGVNRAQKLPQCYNLNMSQVFHIVPISVDELLAKQLCEQGWGFNWSLRGSATSAKFALEINSTVEGLVEFDREPQNLCNRIFWLEIDPHNRGKQKQYEGVAGALLAFVAQDSFACGFDGFIVLESKSEIIQLYVEKYGATQIGNSQELYFDTVASRNLIQRYLLTKEIRYEQQL
jgi:hypothetical protein